MRCRFGSSSRCCTDQASQAKSLCPWRGVERIKAGWSRIRQIGFNGRERLSSKVRPLGNLIRKDLRYGGRSKDLLARGRRSTLVKHSSKDLYGRVSVSLCWSCVQAIAAWYLTYSQNLLCFQISRRLRCERNLSSLRCPRHGLGESEFETDCHRDSVPICPRFCASSLPRETWSSPESLAVRICAVACSH